VESALSQAPLVAQLFVHGDSSEDKLVAIAVLDEDAVTVWLKAMEFKSQGSSDTDLEAAVLAQMKEVGRQNGLKGYELVYGGNTSNINSTF
jgi:long-subunit acyl-CoA synthetase (AMP-forming)